MSILIKNAKIVDGTGSPWFWSDILVEDKEIKRMERKLDVKADRTIDAKGLIVSPGFVDTHCHPDGVIIFHPELDNHVAQGNTTLVFGSDGGSLYPDKENWLDWAPHFYGADTLLWSKHFAKAPYAWNSLTDLSRLVMSRRPAINTVPLIGLSLILWKAGYKIIRETEARRLTAKEMAEVKELLKQGFKEGAPGLSTNRDANPDRYVPMDQYLEQLKVAAEYGRDVFMHTKAICTPPGIREAIEIAKQTAPYLHILHVNVMPNWDYGKGNKLPECLGLIESAREEGLDITFDVMCDFDWYYRRDSLTRQLRFICRVFADKPPKGVESIEEFEKNLEDPDYRKEIKHVFLESVGRAAGYQAAFWQEHLDSVILKKTGDERLEGKTLGQIAKEEGTNPTDLFFDIAMGVSPILAKKPDALVILPKVSGHPNQENAVVAANHPLGMPSSEYSIQGTSTKYFYFGSAAYGMWPGYFRSAIQSGVRMEEAIRKMTSYPARVLGLTDRGILRPCMKADIVIFDPVEFRSVADYDHPTALAEGVSYVMVNGRLVLDDGKLTEERPGEVLLRGVQ